MCTWKCIAQSGLDDTAIKNNPQICQCPENHKVVLLSQVTCPLRFAGGSAHFSDGGPVAILNVVTC